MTGRDKIRAAFSEEGTSETAAVLPYEGIYLRDRWDELTSRPWWEMHDRSIERQIEWRSEAWSRIGHDWFQVHGFYSPEERESIVIEPRPEGVFQVDRRTRKAVRIHPPEIGGYGKAGLLASLHPDKLADTPEEIDALTPLPEPVASSDIRWDGRDDLAKAIMAGFGENLCPISHVSSPLWRCYDIWGFEGMMEMIAVRPDLARHACERLLASSMQEVRQAASLGAEVIWIEECLTDQIGPEAFGALDLPFLRTLIETIREEGMKSIYYYCGDPAGKWEHILDAGADALSLEEGKKGFEIDIEDVVDRVQGRCTLLGNLDAIGVLQDATDDRLRSEVLRQITAGRMNGGRFIMSLGSPVTPGTPVSRVRLYCDLAHELGAGERA